MKTTEILSGCTRCMYDSRVLMQRLMVLQTTLKWTSIQCSLQRSEGSSFAMRLGRYKIPQEEGGRIRASLLIRMIDGDITTLKALESKIEYMKLQQPSKETWEHEEQDYEHIQQIICSLVGKCSQLRATLISDKSHYMN